MHRVIKLTGQRLHRKARDQAERCLTNAANGPQELPKSECLPCLTLIQCPNLTCRLLNAPGICIVEGTKKLQIMLAQQAT